MPDPRPLSFTRPVRLHAPSLPVREVRDGAYPDPAYALMQVVDELYSAAESQARWPDAVAHTAGALSACAAGFMWSNGDGRWQASVWHAREDSELELPAADGTVPDGLNSLLTRLRSVLPGRVVTATDRSGGAAHALAIRLAPEGGSVGALVALCGERRRGFSSADRIAAATLAPHLCRALALGGRRQREGAIEHVREGLLSAPARGALLVDASGWVFGMAGVAAQLCDARDGIVLDDGRIAASVASFTAALRRAIRDVAGGECTALARVPALRLPRGDAGEPLEVRVVPLPAEMAAASMPTGGPVPVAAVIVSDVAHRPPADAAVLARMYGFTPAEASLAEALAAGRTLEQTAVASGLTRETMRSRLKGLFRKTGTRRQADLVARLLCGVAVFAQPPH